uniref:dUTP diphosphatase n=1 Tax=Pacific black duck aviadenovirus TaxID=2798287 RepID=A0A7T4S032_9ADEN|nr:dUTPase [Pacific black duck aviadenovirus]
MSLQESKKGIIQVKKLSPFACLPTKGSPYSVGFDLHSAHSVVLQPHSNTVVYTDLSIIFPPGCYGRIAPRSGLAAKNFIDVGAGVIDPDFRGNIGVVLFNFSDKKFNICSGDRIAQIICEKAEFPVLQEVSELAYTHRGSSGFGSTGI